jgi:hypothetical protein
VRHLQKNSITQSDCRLPIFDCASTLALQIGNRKSAIGNDLAKYCFDFDQQ